MKKIIIIAICLIAFSFAVIIYRVFVGNICLDMQFENLDRSAAILLLLPLAAMAVAILRNVVGIQTFGTFTPLLLALAFWDISLFPGILLFFLVAGLGAIVRGILERFPLLLIPRLSIMLTFCVVITIAFQRISGQIGAGQFFSLAFFALIMVTMVIERFHIARLETGIVSPLLLTLSTGIVAAICYLLIFNETLQLIVFVFPEILFAVLGALILLGRYRGLWLVELWKFRPPGKG